MAGTIRGLPYPTGTDFVVDGDNAIRELAESIDERPYFIAGGSANITTSTNQFALTVVEDPFGMIDTATSRVVIPAGFGGLWQFTGRLNQSGVTANTAQLRKIGDTGNTPVLIDSATGAAGAAATPVLSGMIRVAAGDRFDIVATAASGSIAMSLFYPYFTGYFLRA